MRSLFKPDDAYRNIKVEKLLRDKSNVSCFRDVLSDNLVDLDLLVDRIVNENLSIDDGVSNFGAILYNKAYEVFGQLKIIHNGRSCTQRKNSSPWFNNDCVIARAELKRANKLFRKYRTLEYHEHVVNNIVRLKGARNSIISKIKGRNYTKWLLILRGVFGMKLNA